ncbi:MAG: hypothetical protein R3195_14155 [Gemmatimonadota bacterium]|nr:hypothetical protein [Gemmatimonadota bacterium]
MRRRVCRGLVVGWIALAATGCVGGDPSGGDEPLVVRRDSAGVTIVESRAPAWPEGGGARVSSEPSLVIGSLDGPEEEQLFRVFSATRLSDGRIAVANSGTHQVRFYLPDGRLEVALGGEGDGPGEFTSLTSIERLAGDTLYAYDGGQQRLTRISPDGTYLSTTRLESPIEQSSMQYLGSVRPGLQVGRTMDFPAGVADGEVIRADDTAWWIEDGQLTEALRFSRGPHIVQRFQRGEQNIFSIGPAPFTVTDHIAVGPEGILLASSTRFEVRFFGRSGPVTVARYAGTHDPLTAEHVREFVERGDPTPDTRRRREGALETLEPPEHLPAHGGLLVDVDGRPWLRPFGIDETAWTVLDRDGAWLGSVELPPGLAVFEIGSDYVLGVRRDELDVEYLVLHDLEWVDP